MRSYHALAEDVFWLGVDGCPWVVNTTPRHRGQSIASRPRRFTLTLDRIKEIGFSP